MPAIKSIVMKNMYKIMVILAVIVLFLSAFIQISDQQNRIQQNARRIFSQIDQILDENAEELDEIRKEYAKSCLNNARTTAYILEYNPKAKDDVEELRKIASNIEVDEIHIFDTNGVIVAGTHPEYFGYSFDSGSQLGFFKPLLTDKYMEMVQDIMPNTAKGTLVQYSALWSENRKFIVQIGMYPDCVLQVTQKNELSYIFSLLRTGNGYSLYAVNPDTERIVGSTKTSDVDQRVSDIGFQMEQLTSGGAFHAKVNQSNNYCFSQKIGGNYIVWATPISDFYQTIFINELLLLAGLILFSAFLVYAVTGAMNGIVIEPTEKINEDLRSIQNGNLQTKVDIQSSQEFQELGSHINKMVENLLQSSENLKMIRKTIENQKEELERQHEQLEIAVERAETANKTKSEFLFHISHDIRTPMNAILGFTNLALENDDSQIQKEYLENIRISSNQLFDIINDILELTSIKSYKTLLKEELVNVKETCGKLSMMFDNDLKKKHLTYTAKQDIQHSCLYMDTSHYTRIFLNIVSNAIKYTPDGGAIQVLFRELPRDVPNTCFIETVVKDNGIGMSEQFLPLACESFSRERNSTVSGVPGTGLGLTVVKDLVDMMGGAIQIESQQDKGTVVTIRLPHRLGENSEQEETKDLADLDDASFEGRRVLLAEDIDLNALIAITLLTARGFLVDRAKDGAECIQMLSDAQEDFYDLVLMDIQMPNVDGYEATRAIRSLPDAEKAAIPILAMTANTAKEDREKAAQAGMGGYIEKPLDTVVMFRVIAEAFQAKNK